jgi:hypothetical protein
MMADIEQVINRAIKDFDNIEKAINEQGVEVPDGTDTSEYGNKVKEVFDKGYSKGCTDGESVGYGNGYNVGKGEGYTEGQTDGIEQGKQAEYDAFWDTYQKNGISFSYTQAFYSNKWTSVNYKPKYPIVCTQCTSMYNSSEIIDTLVSIDVSACSNITYAFAYVKPLVTIKELIVADNVDFTNAFAGSKNIENITFSGTIGKSLNMQEQTKLSVESVKSAINCLKNFAGTEYENTYKLTLATSVWTRVEETTPPDGYTSWKNYVMDKGWLT